MNENIGYIFSITSRYFYIFIYNSIYKFSYDLYYNSHL